VSLYRHFGVASGVILNYRDRSSYLSATSPPLSLKGSIYTLAPAPEPASCLNSDLAVTVGTKHLAFADFLLNPFYRPTSRYHPCNSHIFLPYMVKPKYPWVGFSASLTRMSKKILVNKFSCGFTSCFGSFLRLL